MSSTSQALVLLSAQRSQLEGRADERELTLGWNRQVSRAREAGHLLVFVQWDGEAGTDHATFSRAWTLYPDFHAEEGEVLVRAVHPDAFAGTDLDAELRARGVRGLELLGLDEETLEHTAARARDLGYAVSGAPAVVA
ncbi:isochorismatase family protein [Deinococcus gobiensis]|uniref:isochorismatase family protein n=1 Tax=Deinococcus gobiensis TaxID=502394 RepID=UPI0005C1E2A4|nr:isochorismatase family protein [Deinococcus gobiensis]